jgi:hypothetical protein
MFVNFLLLSFIRVAGLKMQRTNAARIYTFMLKTEIYVMSNVDSNRPGLVFTTWLGLSVVILNVNCKYNNNIVYIYIYIYTYTHTHIFFLFTRPMKMETTECSQTSAHKIQTLGNHPKDEYNIHNTAKFWNQEYFKRFLYFIFITFVYWHVVILRI